MIKFLLSALFLFPFIAFAQVQVQINSGNPVCPFPQFQPYANPTDTLGNLATKNASGVSHAEMEKTIREAYQIMMNRAYKPGGDVGGIDYVKFISEPDCSEGDGYAMLAAVAMCDKATFDGLWLWIHDNAMNKVTRYSDCEESSPGYRGSALPGWINTAGSNSAADGDFDIALALLGAYKQWGEFMGIDDACGNRISYKQAAIDFLKALTDTFVFISDKSKYLSGDIGFDGYFKSGDSWQELTDWATTHAKELYNVDPESKGPNQQHFDYTAPSYFNQFAKFLTEQNKSAYSWNISQFNRAEASSDWLMGQLLKDPKTIPYVGQVELGSDNVPVFSNVQTSADMRLPWRTILNRVWNGNPSNTWDPQTHQVKTGVSNTFEQDIGKRYARFLWDNRQEPWCNSCVTSESSPAYWGPSVLWTEWDMFGSNGSFFFLNWNHGTGSPSAIVAQDFNLMAEMYRQCEIEFDVEEIGDGYLTSIPFYFHEWFRLLGLLILSGNYPSPSSIKPSANMKIYCDIDKTYAFPVSKVKYTISYRNFGSIDAQNVVIIDTLPKGLSYVECTGNGSYNPSNHTVKWTLGTVPGFKSSTGAEATTGEISLTLSVDKSTRGQCINRATVQCSNGSGWTANEYCNLITPTLKRNFLDIIDPPDGNVSGVLPIHGGRSGVHFSSFLKNDGSTSVTIGIRLFSDAQESYIDYGNYRLSYFLFDTSHTCIADQQKDSNTGWSINQIITEGIDHSSVRFLHEMLPPGEDSHGKWNQRIIIQFSDPLDTTRINKLWTTNQHLERYIRMEEKRIHRGGTLPLRLVCNIQSSQLKPVRWDDDWSWDSTSEASTESSYFPVTPDYTEPAFDNKGKPVDRLHPKNCETVPKTIDNLLIEEWDGYTWRKVFGNAPQLPVPTNTPKKTSRYNFSINRVTGSTIFYTMPEAAKICLQILDIQGRVIATLINGHKNAGNHKIAWYKKGCNSGIFILKLTSPEKTMYSRVVKVR